MLQQNYKQLIAMLEKHGEVVIKMDGEFFVVTGFNMNKNGTFDLFGCEVEKVLPRFLGRFALSETFLIFSK